MNVEEALDVRRDAIRVSESLVFVGLSSEQVVELTKYLPGNSSILALVESELREQGLWVEPSMA